MMLCPLFEPHLTPRWRNSYQFQEAVIVQPTEPRFTDMARQTDPDVITYMISTRIAEKERS